MLFNSIWFAFLNFHCLWFATSLIQPIHLIVNIKHLQIKKDVSLSLTRAGRAHHLVSWFVQNPSRGHMHYVYLAVTHHSFSRRPILMCKLCQHLLYLPNSTLKLQLAWKMFHKIIASSCFTFNGKINIIVINRLLMTMKWRFFVLFILATPRIACFAAIFLNGAQKQLSTQFQKAAYVI